MLVADTAPCVALGNAHLQDFHFHTRCMCLPVSACPQLDAHEISNPLATYLSPCSVRHLAPLFILLCVERSALPARVVQFPETRKHSLETIVSLGSRLHVPSFRAMFSIFPGHMVPFPHDRFPNVPLASYATCKATAQFLGLKAAPGRLMFSSFPSLAGVKSAVRQLRHRQRCAGHEGRCGRGGAVVRGHAVSLKSPCFSITFSMHHPFQPALYAKPASIPQTSRRLLRPHVAI